MAKTRNRLLSLAMALAVCLSLSFGAAILPAGAEDAHAATAPTLTITKANTGKVGIAKGKTYALGAKATSGSRITYSSSNKKVATVSSKGTVKALRPGKATITVKAKRAGKATTKKVYVTVVAASKYKPVKKVYAKASASSLTAGETAKVSYSFSPKAPSNGNVTFKSSNTKVLTVSAAGKVTAKAAGTAKVTVYSCYSAKRYATVTVKVYAKPKGVSIDCAEALEVGGTVAAKASVSPSTALQSVTWKSSDASIATVSSKGVVTGISEGVVTITVASKKDPAKKASVQVAVVAPGSGGAGSGAVTRGQYAVDLCEALGFEAGADDACPYGDLAGSECAGAVSALWAQGAFGDDRSESFGPDEPATRGFCAVTAVRALGYELDGTALSCADAEEVPEGERVLAAIALDEGLLALDSGSFLYGSPMASSEEEALISRANEIVLSRSLAGEEDACDIVYADDVAVAGEGYVSELSEDGEATVVLDEAPEGLEVGGVLVVQPNDEDPVGAAVVVESISAEDPAPADSSAAVALGAGDVCPVTVKGRVTKDADKVFKEMYCIHENPFPADERARFAPAQGVSVPGSRKASDSVPASLQIGIESGRGTFKYEDGSLTAEVTLAEEKQDGGDSGEVTVSVKMTPKVDKLAVVLLNPDHESRFNARVAVDVDGTVKGSVKADRTIPLGVMAMPLGSTGFTVVGQVFIHVQVDGSVSAEFKAVPTLTVSAGKRFSHVGEVRDRSISGFTAEGGAKIGPMLDLTLQFASIDLYDVGVEGGIEAKCSSTQRNTGMICSEVKYWLYFEFFGGRTSTNLFDLMRKAYPSFPSVKFTLEILGEEQMAGGGLRHWENGNEVKKCTWSDKVDTQSSVEQYTWSELKIIADKIAAAPSDAAGLEIAKKYNLVGADGKLTGNETKEVVLSDWADQEYDSSSDGWQGAPLIAQVQILGFRHDRKADGSLVGITFGFKDVVGCHAMNAYYDGAYHFADGTTGSKGNAGGWANSQMRAWLNGGFYCTLPDSLQGCIVEVEKETNNQGYVGANDPSVVSATEDKVWLLGLSEYRGELSSYSSNVPSYPGVYDAEGVQYQLYRDNNVTMSFSWLPRKKRAWNGSDSGWWWLRSPYADTSDNFHHVIMTGGWDGYHAEYGHCVSPCFCF